MERKNGIESAEVKCTHRFVIESPNGPESSGYCKKCGFTKNFPNGMQIAPDTVGNLLKPSIKDQRKEHKRRTAYLTMASELPPPDLD